MEDDKFDMRALSDIDIEIRVRSGESDLREITKLINAIKASLTSGILPKIELTEATTNSKNIPGSALVSILYKFHLD